MSETLTTNLGAVLGHTTGVLLSPLGDLYDVQDFLVGRPLMTHERIAPEADVSAELLRQFPRLAEAHPPSLGRSTKEETKAACLSWVSSVAEYSGYPLTVIVTTPTTTHAEDTEATTKESDRG